MKVRTTPHTPAASSLAYDVGGMTITLAPGKRRWFDQHIELAIAANQLDLSFPVNQIQGALGLGRLWDDPKHALETSFPDELTPETALAYAKAVIDELEADEWTDVLDPARALMAPLKRNLHVLPGN